MKRKTNPVPGEACGCMQPSQQRGKVSKQPSRKRKQTGKVTINVVPVPSKMTRVQLNCQRHRIIPSSDYRFQFSARNVTVNVVPMLEISYIIGSARTKNGEIKTTVNYLLYELCQVLLSLLITCTLLSALQERVSHFHQVLIL